MITRHAGQRERSLLYLGRDVLHNAGQGVLQNHVLPQLQQLQ